MLCRRTQRNKLSEREPLWVCVCVQKVYKPLSLALCKIPHSSLTNNSNKKKNKIKKKLFVYFLHAKSSFITYIIYSIVVEAFAYRSVRVIEQHLCLAHSFFRNFSYYTFFFLFLFIFLARTFCVHTRLGGTCWRGASRAELQHHRTTRLYIYIYLVNTHGAFLRSDAQVKRTRIYISE